MLKEEKVFRDPVHRYVHVQDQVIWDLIGTKEMQRLRRIRQLGTSFYTFHGAEHSRFSHSLGVYEITRKIISQFERHHLAEWPQEERLLCLCAALLHDVGHGPFSHSIEAALHMNHEDWTCRILTENTEVNQVLRKVSAEFPDKVAEVIQKKYPKSIVVSLISSQLDADRMDYILRDAYHTGANYGTYDLERIIRVLRPHKGHLVIKESGMHAVEAYLMSRYQMHWQVYFHPVTRSSEIILTKIFQRAKALYESGYQFSFLCSPMDYLIEGTVSVEQYMMLDESFIQMTMMQWTLEKDHILSDLCSRFLHRRLFKYTSMEQIDESLIDAVRLKLSQCGYDPEYYMAVDFPSDLSYDVNRPGMLEKKIPIYLLTESDELVDISEKSHIVRSISGIHNGMHHLYFPEGII
ncbi:HD domain-containing protein [Marinicrinis lubricantis]|uniref:HD domain-containing protein n=1 Tax=Marinicrinis lubricantis TaxID=2086470 RepID=A0ABW1IQE2_9BACL